MTREVAQFPMGIGSFVMVLILVSVTGSFLGAPFYYWVDDGIDLGFWRVDAIPESLLLTLIGFPITFMSLHLMNGAAFVHGRLTLDPKAFSRYSPGLDEAGVL